MAYTNIREYKECQIDLGISPLCHGFPVIKCMHVKGNVYSFLYLKLNIRLWDVCEDVCSLNLRWVPPLRGRTFMTGRFLLNGTTFFPKVLLNPSSPCIATGSMWSAWPHAWPQRGGMKRRRVSISETCKIGGSVPGIHGVSLKILKSITPKMEEQLSTSGRNSCKSVTGESTVENGSL